MRRRADLLAVAVLLLLPTLYFADVAVGRKAFFFVDLMRFHHPQKKVLRDIVMRGEFPYWNPYVSAGQPLAANPQSEVFYPLNWLIFLPSYETGFQLLVLLHIALALLTMYALLRSLDLQPPAAAIGAFSWGLGGAILSFHHMLPHLFSAAWLPLTCLFARRALLDRRPRDFALASLFLGVQFLVGEPALILETAIVVGAFAVCCGLCRKNLVASVLLAAAIGIAGLVVGAAQMLPAIDHARDSVRSRGIPWSVASLWSLPPIRIGELLYPNLLGHMSRGDRMFFWGASAYDRAPSPYLFNIYSGMLVGVLALAGFAARSRGWPLAAALVAVSFLLALGANTPVVQILFDFGLNFLRYFEKFALLGVFTLVIFSSLGLQSIVDGNRRLRIAAIVVTAAVTAVALFFALRGGHWHFDPTRLGNEMRAVSRTDWWLATLRGAALLLILVAFTRVRRPLWIALVALFVVADLTPIIREITPRTNASFFRQTPLAAKRLAAWPGRFRIFHEAEWRNDSPLARTYVRLAGLHLEPLRNGMLPPIPSEFGLSTVMESDYDFTLLSPTDDFIAAMARVGYRSRSGWPQPMAAMSNAWFRTEYRPIEDALNRAQGDLHRLQPVAFFPLQPHPRYYFASNVVGIRGRDDFIELLKRQPFDNDVAFAAVPPFTPARGVVRGVRETANTIRIEAESAGRAFLVLSVTPHKYWHVHVDGRDAQPVITNLGYQGLPLGKGGHVIEMRYRNPLIAVGVAISIVTILVLAAVAAVGTMRAP